MKKAIRLAVRFALPVLMLFGVGLGHAGAVEYFVTQQGADTNAGLNRAAAFRTIQRGFDCLKPGDRLTIGPGEYAESVRRDNLGGSNAATVIRAEIPGTVVLRGDMPAPEFRPLTGHPFVYVADLAVTSEVVVVNELDTLKVFQRMPSVAELDFVPGVFHQDRAAGKLYLSTSDMEPASSHRYTLSVIPTHGIYLSNPRRVTLEGLAATGFNAVMELHHREGTMGGVWGMFLVNGKDCVIRDCRAWLNGWGIGVKSEAGTSGDNVIERCVAWGNASPFWFGDMGGLSIFNGRRDVIRDSTAFLNGMYGINIYGTGTDGGTYGDKNVAGNDEKNKSRLVNNLAWGNWCDYKIKTGVDNFHVAERCVGMLWSIPPDNIHHSLIGDTGRKWLGDSLVLGAETHLDANREFADPDNHDYRLQSTARFRGKAPDGSDRGPHVYQSNVFYASPAGADTADGLSVSNAWKTLGRAVKALRPGDTLYLQPGVYAGDVELVLRGAEGMPVSILGRGREPAIVEGAVRVRDSRGLEFKRLHFRGSVNVTKGADLAFENCQFTAADTGLKGDATLGLTVAHCVFTGSDEAAVGLKGCAQVRLNGNLYDLRHGAALRLDAATAIVYSDYNSYRKVAGSWNVNGRAVSPTDLNSQELVPGFAVTGGVAVLKNPALFASRGPFGKPIGIHRDELRQATLRLIGKPTVHSVSATTANLEWRTSQPATCDIAWGETADCTNTLPFDVNHFGSYGLTGLKPGRTYYFRITALQTPRALAKDGPAERVALKGDALSFRTAKENAKPVVYIVAPEGDDANTGRDRQHAWRTLQQAANRVNVGDTVLMAGGTYRERVRMRATGDEGSPITFKSMPGERVVMDGAGKTLNAAFLAGGKSFLKFDGLYFVDFNFDPAQGWILQFAGEFNLYQCKDIEITRCLSDGRNGYTARSVTAWHVENLRINNCVNMNKMSGAMMLDRCPGLRLEHCVFARPMISCFVLRNDKDQPALLSGNIFTDMLQKKADLNANMFDIDRYMDGVSMDNNCYFLRSFPPKTRFLVGQSTIEQLGQNFHTPLFADPGFAGDPGVKGKPSPRDDFSPERMMDRAVAVDFNSFFATNPEVVKRGIGLQPVAFKDFAFNREDSVAKGTQK